MQMCFADAFLRIANKTVTTDTSQIPFVSAHDNSVTQHKVSKSSPACDQWAAQHLGGVRARGGLESVSCGVSSLGVPGGRLGVDGGAGKPGR